MKPAPVPNKEVKAQLLRLKSYYPFRICFAAQNPDTKEFVVRAVYSTRPMKLLIKKGWRVWGLKK